MDSLFMQYEDMMNTYFDWQADYDNEVKKNRFVEAASTFCYSEAANPFALDEDLLNAAIKPDGNHVVTAVEEGKYAVQ